MNVDEEKSNERQSFVFSATLTLVHDIPDYLQRKKQKNSRSKIFKLTPGQKLQKVIDLLRMKNPKVVDVTKAQGIYMSQFIVGLFPYGTIILFIFTLFRNGCLIDGMSYNLYDGSQGLLFILFLKETSGSYFGFL